MKPNLTEKFKSGEKFLMLALDHRGSFKKLISPQDPESVSDETVMTLKEDIIKSLLDDVSGLLVDEVYGLPAYDALLKICHDCSKPFILPLEKSGFREDAAGRFTDLEYNVIQLIELGASGAKLLLYINPFLESAKHQLEIAKKALEDCRRYKTPLFIEFVTYGEDKENSREKLIVGALEYFLQANVVPDVFKLEYPGSLEGCSKISKILGDTPWILLTRGEDFETFSKQLEEAVQAGCQGFLAGRALWQEVCKLEGEEKQRFLTNTLPERFRAIAQIAKVI